MVVFGIEDVTCFKGGGLHSFLGGGLFYCKYLVFPMGGFSDKMKIEKLLENGQ